MRTLADRIPGHGSDLLGQRYAFDFVRPDHRKGLHLHLAGPLRTFARRRAHDDYGWGQPIYAAFDGQVMAAVDGMPERGGSRVPELA